MKKNSAKKTYCNPLAIPDIPRGKDEWYSFEYGMFSHENKPESVTTPDYRSISDPTVFFYDGKWYLYPSYGMAWVSEDFQNWKHVKTEPYCPKYSPCIIPWKGKFLLTSWFCPLYVADTPLGPFNMLGDFIGTDGKGFTPCDPCLFRDDDGRIFMYEFAAEKDDSYNGFICKIVGYELDDNNPRQVIKGPIDIIRMNPDQNVWERHGLHNQDKTFGWIEGPHLIKVKSRYYLIYAAPDTCDASYVMAVYYSDKSPLENFVCQKKNPLTFHREGIITGAGHGCVERGPNNTLWAFYTIATPCTHRYERRIGMDLVDIDENGELYCPHGVTDTPQYIPGFYIDATCSNSPGLYSLTGGVRPVVSSEKDGHFALYATDENNLSWWQPEDSDNAPFIECELGNVFTVSSVRIFWKEIGLDYASGIIPEPMRYKLDVFENGNWKTVLDKSDSTEEKNIDYQVFDDVKCSKVRLTVKKPAKIKFGIIDFTVFGKM